MDDKYLTGDGVPHGDPIGQSGTVEDGPSVHMHAAAGADAPYGGTESDITVTCDGECAVLSDGEAPGATSDFCGDGECAIMGAVNSADAETPTKSEDEVRSEAVPSRSRLYGKKYLAFCFLVPAAVMVLIYVALGVWPVSDNSALVLDLNAQYIYYLEKLRSILCDGGSFLYTFERALGGEFMGIFAYYLASPFNLIFTLFPKEYITESLLLILILKCGACGFTFGIFLNGTHRERRPAADIIFSSMYALSAFAVVMQHNLMWTDNLICLPLILYGVDRIIKYGKYKTFTIFLALAVFSNFYIGYMTCLFVAIYFFVRYFSLTREERNPRGVRLNFLRALSKTVAFSLIGVGMAAVVIFTAYYSLSFGKLTFSKPDFTPKQLYDIGDVISKVFFGSYDSVRPEGMPFLYAGMLMPLLTPLYFITPGIPKRRKIGAGFLMLLFFVSFNLSTADLIWHGFQRPNWLNARFAFIFIFVALLMAYEVFIRLREFPYRRVVICGAVLVLILVFLQKSGLENLPDFKAVWASVGIIGLYLAVLSLTGRRASGRGMSLASVALAAVVCTELFAAGVVNLYDLDEDVSYSSRESYRDFIDPYLRATEKVDDDGFYRSEKLEHRKTNDNFAIGLRGLSNSTSTLNSSVIELLQEFGFTSRSHWSKYVGGTAVSDSIFGIKYLYADEDESDAPWYVKEYYERITTTEDGITIYRNPNAMSVAFTMPDGFDGAGATGESYKNPFELMNTVISGRSGTDIWVQSPVTDISYTGCRQFGVQDNHTGYEKNSDDATAIVSITTVVNCDDPLYMYIPAKWDRKANLKVNGRNFGNYFTNDTHAIVELGTFTPGESVTVEFTMSEDKMYMRNGGDYFYTFDRDAFELLTGAFSDVNGGTAYTDESLIGAAAAGPSAFTYGGLNVTSHSEDRISGTVTVKDGMTTLLTTIPYDEGWQITCDGETVIPRRALGALLAVDLTPGEHTVEMRYMPDAFRYGAAVSLSSAALFAVICVCSYLWRMYRRRKAAGDVMLPSPVAEGTPDGEEKKMSATRRRIRRSINDLHIKRQNNRN